MKETMIETDVTYTLEFSGKFNIIEHVPVRVCQETGEQFFSPETVEYIQTLIKGGRKPLRVIETPGGVVGGVCGLLSQSQSHWRRDC